MSATEDAIRRGGGAATEAETLAGCVRRLAVIADRAVEPEQVFRALARELGAATGAEEVHVHHIGGQDGRERVVIYLFDGDGRVSYVTSTKERPPAVNWVAATGRSFLAVSERELLASVPRLARGEQAARSALLSPLHHHGETSAVLTMVARGGVRFDEGSVGRARALIDQAAVAIALLDARAEAGTDAVTGCMNHRAMRRRLREEVARAGRVGGSLSCLLIDIDDFKLVNDRLGHRVGDEALAKVAQTLMGEFRQFDRVARYGGDEFVVILPEADLESAAAAGERALQRLSRITVHGEHGLGASIGVAQWRSPMGVVELLEACDTALLEGKREGKNRVRVNR